MKHVSVIFVSTIIQKWGIIKERGEYCVIKGICSRGPFQKIKLAPTDFCWFNQLRLLFVSYFTILPSRSPNPWLHGFSLLSDGLGGLALTSVRVSMTLVDGGLFFLGKVEASPKSLGFHTGDPGTDQYHHVKSREVFTSIRISKFPCLVY